MQQPAPPQKPSAQLTLMDGVFIGACIVAFVLIIALMLQG